MCRCSLRIQALVSNRGFILSPAVLEHDVGTGFPKRSCSNKKIKRDDNSKKSHPALGNGPGPVGRRRRAGRSRRTPHRQFLGRVARQFLGAWRFARLAHRRRCLRLRISWWSFRRGFDWIAGRRRRDFGRLDRHRALLSEFRPAASTTPIQRCSRRAASAPAEKFNRAATACCSGSCRSRRSRARACRRCSRPAIHSARDARSPPPGATATAALP
jgi:hypothetical protein